MRRAIQAVLRRLFPATLPPPWRAPGMDRQVADNLEQRWADRRPPSRIADGLRYPWR